MSSIDNGHVENNSYISIDYKIVQIGFAIINSLNGNTTIFERSYHKKVFRLGGGGY